MCLAGLLRGTPFYAGFLPQETATLHLLVPHPEGTDQVKKANSSLSAPTYHFVSFLPWLFFSLCDPPSPLISDAGRVIAILSGYPDIAFIITETPPITARIPPFHHQAHWQRGRRLDWFCLFVYLVCFRFLYKPEELPSLKKKKMFSPFCVAPVQFTDLDICQWDHTWEIDI